jgi:hypothetical protein
VAADGHDQAHVGERVHVPGVALEHGLVGGDGLRVVAVEEALARGVEHAGEHLGRDGLAGLEADVGRAHRRIAGAEPAGRRPGCHGLVGLGEAAG